MSFEKPKSKEYDLIKSSILTALKDKSPKVREDIGKYLLDKIMGGGAENIDHAMTNFQRVSTDGKLITKTSKNQDYKYPIMAKLNSDEDIKEALKATGHPNLNLQGVIKAVAIPKWMEHRKRITKMKGDAPSYELIEPIAVLFVHNQCQKDYKKPKKGEEVKPCIADEINSIESKDADTLWKYVDGKIKSAKDHRFKKAEEVRKLRETKPDLEEFEKNITNPWELFTGSRAEHYKELAKNERAGIPLEKRKEMIEKINKCLELMKGEWVEMYEFMRGCIKIMK